MDTKTMHLIDYKREKSFFTEQDARQGALTLARTGTGIGRRASDIEAVPLQWLWEGYLARGKVELFVGPSGVGKSMFGVDIAARVSRGGLWPDGTQAEQNGVVLAMVEDVAEDTLIPRLQDAGADLTQVYVLNTVHESDAKINGSDSEHQFNLPSDLGALEQAILEVNAGLVILDPLKNVCEKYTNDDTARTIMTGLERLAETYGVCIVLLGHFTKAWNNKANETNWPQLVGGASMYFSRPRMDYVFLKDAQREGIVNLACVKSNIGTPEVVSYSIAKNIEGKHVVQYLERETGNAIVDVIAAPEYSNEMWYNIAGCIKENERALTPLEICHKLAPYRYKYNTIQQNIGRMIDAGLLTHDKVTHSYNLPEQYRTWELLRIGA